MKLKKITMIEVLILFICFVIVSIYFTYSLMDTVNERETKIKILVNEASANVRSVTAIYERHLMLLRSRAEEFYSESDFDYKSIKNRIVDVGNKGWELLPTEKDSLSFIGRITGLGFAKDISSEELYEIYMAEKLNKLFATANNNIQNVPFIYYISKKKFWNLTPRNLKDFSFFIPDYNNYELYTMGLPENNPNRRVFWTKPYFDAGGNGLMVTASIPFYNKSNFLGTISIDMLFNDIANYLKSSVFTDYSLSVVDNYGQVVSSTIKNFISPDKIITLDNLIDNSKSNIEQFESDRFIKYENKRIFASRIKDTKWHIFYFENYTEFLINIILQVLPIFSTLVLLLIIIYMLLYTNRLRIENEAARVKAEVANSTKDKFFSIISHDLRGPFNSLLGFSELIEDDLQHNNYENLGSYFGHIKEGIKNILKLLENLLLWAQLQRESIKVNPVELSLFTLANEAIETLRQPAQSKSITTINEIPIHLKAFADKSMISTTIRNLVSNAIKFTPHGGTINISAYEKERFVIVTIKDNGTGISPETVEKLFNISKKISTLGTQGETGTGLGLALCKEFIEMNNGRIWVESELDKGSLFHFTIPSINL